MQKCLLNAALWIIIGLFFNTSQAQNTKKFTISGYVRDANNGENLIAASLAIKELQRGTVTNEYGFFTLTLDSGTYTLFVNFVGYEPQKQLIKLQNNIQLNLKLIPKSIVGQEVVIEADRSNANISETDLGKIEIDLDQVKQLPVLMGEVDILKTVQLLPGVQGAGEGNAGFYVRGGGPDQNLILLDEAVVYNASHLFGFFSVFNADAINNTTLIKGNMPAQYGGRVSSVLNIVMKEGNNQKFEAEGGIGLIASRLTLQGPIIKDKSSFIVSARRTYIDVLVDPFVASTSRFKGTGYFFYDLNAKINYKLSNKDRLYLSGYFGRDIFTFRNRNRNFFFQVPWGNATATARWNHVFKNKVFMNTTAVFSNYQFQTNVEQGQFAFQLQSGVQNFTIKKDFDFYLGQIHKMKAGTLYTNHLFTPATTNAQSGQNRFGPENVTRLQAHEWAAYLLDEVAINHKFLLNMGLRVSAFRPVGPYTYTLFDSLQNVLYQKSYEKGELVTAQGGLEPRLSIRYQLDEKSALKLGISRNIQYIHLASSSGATLPTDLWVPSSKKTKPQIGWQYAAGYFRNFDENKWEASVEIYYKDMFNLIDFRNGATGFAEFNVPIENDFVFGTGQSYGIELFVKKRVGKFTGWIGYTHAYAWRQFDDINNGKRFPFRYDRRHDLSIVTAYEPNQKWTLSGVFVYATGDMLTLPTSFYFFEGRFSQEIGERNNFRQIPYHRLDFSAVYKPLPKIGSKFKHSWTFAVYNLYSRLNPYFIYFDPSGSLANNNFQVQSLQVSLFPIIPSVTWNFKF